MYTYVCIYIYIYIYIYTHFSGLDQGVYSKDNPALATAGHRRPETIPLREALREERERERERERETKTGSGFRV